MRGLAVLILDVFRTRVHLGGTLLHPCRPVNDTYFLLTFTFLDIFVLLGPASASNQEEMLGSLEECILVDCRLDSGAVLIR